MPRSINPAEYLACLPELRISANVTGHFGAS
jgi:hypothetical protein